jgi:WD40 repeat protein
MKKPSSHYYRNRLVSRLLSSFVLFPFFAVAAGAAAAPREAQEPILRLEPGGPTSFVSAVAFSPDGRTLYAAGSDKVVYVWMLDAATGRFVLDPAATYRVPIGPGLHGALNALAVSPDGSLLAVAGQGLVKVASGMREPGIAVPEVGGLDDEGYRQQGTIYVFDTRLRTATPLVGHLGPVLAMTFLPAAAGKPPLLVSAAKERTDAAGKYVGAVRLWNASNGQYLGGILDPDPFELNRPALAAWHTGKETSQVRIAFAWGNSSNLLRVWDVAKNVLVGAADGGLNNVATLGPVPGQLLSGSIERLTSWRLPDDASQPPVIDRKLALSFRSAPRAIALFASRAGGRVDRAAIVVRFADRGEEDHLCLVDLDSFSLVPGADALLWSGSGTMPAIATAPSGRYVAIAGGMKHELKVFAVDELPAGGGRAQSLTAPGIMPRFAEFVSNKDGLGLLFSEQAPAGLEGAARQPAQGDLIFDPDPRIGVTQSTANWTRADALAPGWTLSQQQIIASAKPSEADSEIQVRSPEGRSARMRLKAGLVVTATAILPPNPICAVPLVAVAAHERGQPWLYLYNGQTGEPLRMFQEHVEKISSLGFSRDGRFLLSAGEDRLICVWSLLDVGDVLGKRGELTGIALAKEGGKIVVARRADNSPPQLAQGDELAGIFEQGRLRPISSPLEFYLAISRIKPGDSVTLARVGGPTVLRGGGQNTEVPVRVGQCVDERKPLFALFVGPTVLRGGGGAEGSWRWIGWSPMGWYDASQSAAAQLLGWHFNTGEAAQPARFAQVQQYQSLHYPGLLPKLLRDGIPPVNKPEPPLPRPAARLSLEEPGQPPHIEDQPVLLIRSPATRLRLLLLGPAADHLESVGWKLGSAEAKPCSPDGENRWLIPLDAVLQSRGDQSLSIAMRTRESDPQVFTEKYVVRYQPLPPAVAAVVPKANRSEVHEPDLIFRARAFSADPKLCPQMQFTLLQTAGTQEVFRQTWISSAAAPIEKTLRLKLGDNVIRLEAANVGATSSAAETAIVTRTVVYSQLHSPPPQLAVSVSEGGAGKSRWPPGTGERIVVDQPLLRIEGQVSAAEPLTELSWKRDAADAARPAAGFEAGKNASANVSQDIRLEPGPQTISFGGKTAHSEWTAAVWNVTYRPPLPQVAWTSPADGLDLVATQRVPGDPPSIAARGRLIYPHGDRGRYPLSMTLYRNGNPLPPQVVAPEQREVSANVALEPGRNRLQWRLADRWDSESLSDVREVRYRRPPRVVRAECPAEANEQFVDCVFHVASPADLPLLALTLNGRELPVTSAVVENRESDAVVWKVAVPRIALKEGPNTIVFAARNNDGETLEPCKLQVKVTVPPPPKANVVFLSPVAEVRTDESELTVRVRAKSASRLEGLFLRYGKVISKADMARQIARGSDGFELTYECTIPLDERVHALEAVVVNRGGESSDAINVTYVPQPVRLIIDSVETAQGKVTSAQRGEGGQPVFPQAVDQGIVWIKGRVCWANDAQRQRTPYSNPYISVNGFLQPLASKDEPVDGMGHRRDDEDPAAKQGLNGTRKLEQSWKVRVRLNQEKDNQVKVRLPGLPQDAANRTSFRIDCDKPDARQRLLMLVISVPEVEKEDILSQSVKAVNGTLTGQELKTPAFRNGRVFGPLIGERASKYAINTQLCLIGFALNQKVDSNDLGNDVVLIYYRGAESLAASGQIHMVTGEEDASFLNEAELAGHFDKAPGAQIFLLDVQRSPTQTKSPESREASQDASRMAVMRCAYLKRSQAAPDRGLLLEALKVALPQARNLREVESDVSRNLGRKVELGVLFYDQIPDDLYSLVLRKP